MQLWNYASFRRLMLRSYLVVRLYNLFVFESSETGNQITLNSDSCKPNRNTIYRPSFSLDFVWTLFSLKRFGEMLKVKHIFVRCWSVMNSSEPRSKKYRIKGRLRPSRINKTCPRQFWCGRPQVLFLFTLMCQELLQYDHIYLARCKTKPKQKSATEQNKNGN